MARRGNEVIYVARDRNNWLKQLGIEEGEKYTVNIDKENYKRDAFENEIRILKIYPHHLTYVAIGSKCNTTGSISKVDFIIGKYKLVKISNDLAS